MKDLAVLLLAGGHSRRLGRDKRLVDLHGQSLLEVAVAELRALRHPIFLAADLSRDCIAVPEGVAVIADRREQAGPLPVLLEIMGRWEGPVLLQAVDVIGPRRAFLDAFIAFAEGHPTAAAIVARHSDSWNPLDGIYRPSFLASLQAAEAAAELSLRRLLSSGDLDLQAFQVEAEDERPNLNQLEDLASLRASQPQGE